MNNPYQSSWARRIKARKRIWYPLVLLIRFPEYLVWLVFEGFERFGFWLDRVSWAKGPLKPLFLFIRFAQQWLKTRPYIQLLAALPVVIGLVTLLTVYFISLNRGRSGVDDLYLQDAIAAYQVQDFKKADFLFNKLTHESRYQNDPKVLYQAMLVALQNGNIFRYDQLLSRLVHKMKYEPAMLYYLTRLVEQDREVKDTDASEAIEMAEKVIAENDSAVTVGKWRATLANFYGKLGRQKEAIALLEAVPNRTIPEQAALNQLLTQSGQGKAARKSVKETLRQIEQEDPSRSQYLQLWLSSKEREVSMTGDLNDAIVKLKEAETVLAEEMNKAGPNLGQLESWYSGVQLNLMQLYSRVPNGKKKVYQALQRACSVNQMHPLLGVVINQMADPFSEVSVRTWEPQVGVVEYGGMVTHVILGLRLWDQRKVDDARRHFDIARKLDPERMTQLLHNATLARGDATLKELDGDGFHGEALEKLADIHSLLDEQMRLDPKREEQVLLIRARMYSLRNQWQELRDLLDGHMDHWQQRPKIIGYQMLIKAAHELGNTVKIDEYQEQIKDLMAKP